MRNKELIRTIKYLLCAASGTLISFGTQKLLSAIFHMSDTLAYCLSMVIMVVWTFTVNRKFTFRSANNVPVAMLKVALYYSAFIPLSTLLFNALVDNFGMPWVFAKLIISSINFFCCFYYDKIVVFGHSVDTNKEAQREKEQLQENAKNDQNNAK